MRAEGPDAVRGRGDDARGGDAAGFGLALDHLSGQDQGGQRAGVPGQGHAVALATKPLDQPLRHAAASSVPRNPPDWRFQ